LAVEPLDGKTDNHESLPYDPYDNTVKGVGFVEDRVSVWESGPPAAAPENVRDVGLMVGAEVGGDDSTSTPMMPAVWSVNQILPSGPVAIPDG
jgi:hypothetical protein